MEHFARWVVRHRKAVLAAAVLLLIPSVFGAAGTYINYDILTYLPPVLLFKKNEKTFQKE